MHLYCDHIVSGIFLIFLIINFAVAAPVLVQEKLQARVDVVHIPKHAVTMLGKRAGELDEILWDAEGHYFVRPEYSAKPGESSATRPSSSSRPSGLADGPTDVEQPQPSIPEQPSQVSSPHGAPLIASNEEWLNLKLGQPESHLSPNPDRAPLSASDEEWLNLNLGQLEGHLSPNPDRAPLSTSDGEWLNLNLGQPESHFSPNPDRVPLSADDSRGVMKMWLDIIGHPESHSFAKPLPSISEEPLQVSGSDRSPLSADDGLMKMWLNIIGHPESATQEELSVAHTLLSLASGSSTDSDRVRP
ncbi:hypothetical protein BGY98DRAFT_1187788 [Russula aff. rugulosa BPL654]|nr:hypothetical protein BGY98DRAFT_1187788 [Russula aff. rugulosa BPL654]